MFRWIVCSNMDYYGLLLVIIISIIIIIHILNNSSSNSININFVLKIKMHAILNLEKLRTKSNIVQQYMMTAYIYENVR